MTTVYIPRLGDRTHDWPALFHTLDQIYNLEEPIFLDFSRCTFLASNAVAALAAAISWRIHNGTRIEIQWHSFRGDVLDNLRKNGFAGAFGDRNVPWRGNTIQLLNHTECDEDEIVSYLESEWIQKGWLDVTEKLAALVVSKVWEIYGNAFEHSFSKIGTFSCGQYFPNIRNLSLTIVDAGIGIPDNVRRFRGECGMSGEDALAWAFGAGNSTKARSGISRGVGLNLLRSFLSVNGGSLVLYSGDSAALITNGNITFQSLAQPVKGTLVHINLICDDRHYYLTSEA